MSTTIDQKVVEMRFDNQHFENNVSTTMSSLDKLKQKLHLPGATKGLEDVNKAAKNVNMNGLGEGVENVRMKFSALQVMGVTALTNITNRAVDAGMRIAKAFTIDPVKQGLQEYETQINATQTILANTKSKGSTIDDVNKALEELNAYADMTIYNFTEMTRNIGTFTAAGVDLETSVTAIQGIANLAAVSGSTSQQASTAMYQLSQALSSGTVKLMDWNSVVNAGMGGEVFQNALKKTSKELGTGAEAAIKASGSFRESLKDGWLTSEVLTATLKKFTMSGANEYLQKYTGLTKNQIDAYVEQGEEAAKAAAAAGKLGEGVTEEAYALEHASKAMAEKTGKNKQEIKDTLDLAKTATGAATEVKTFSQLWDVMKESAQSGWSQSWKIIIGDFEQAKKLLTPLANTITGFIGKMNDARNRMLEIALNFTAPWKAITDKLGGLKKIASTVEKVTGTLDYFQEVVDRVWMGDFNNRGDNPDRFDLLRQAGYDPRVVQYLVNLGEKSWQAGKVYKLSMEEIEEAHKHFGLSMTKTSQDTADANNDVTESIYELDDAKLKDLGLTDEEIRLYRALEKEAKNQGITMSELAERMSEMNGRDRLIESFKNIGKVIGEVFSTVKMAYKEIFNPPGVEELGIRLFGIIYKFQEFTEKLKASLIAVDEDGIPTGKLTETGEKLKRTFKGIFAALHVVVTLISGPLKIAFKLIKGLLAALDIPILDVTASIGDAIVAFDKWLTSALDFEKMFRALFSFFKDAPKYVTKWYNSFKQTKVFQAALPLFQAAANCIRNLVENVKQTSIFKKVAGFFKPFIDGIKSWINGLKEAENVPKYIFEGLINGLKKGASLVWDGISNIFVKLIEIVKNVLGIHSPSVVFMAIGGFIIAGLIAGLSQAFPGVEEFFSGMWSKILSFFDTIDFGAVLTAVIGIGSIRAVNKFGDAFAGFGEMMAGVGEVLAESAKGIGNILWNTGKVVKGFSKVLKANAFKTRAEGIKTLAVALLMLVAAVIVLTFFDTTELLKAAGVIAVLALILVGLAFAVNLMSKSSVTIGKGAAKINNIRPSLLGIAAALLLMAVTLAIVASLSWGELLKSGLALFAFVGILIVLMRTTQFIGPGVDGLGKTLRKMATAMLLMALVMVIVSGMEASTIAKGILVIAAFAGIMVGLMAATKLIGRNDPFGTIGSTMFKMAGAMLIMAFVMVIISGMSVETIIKGIIVMAAFGVLMTAMMDATKRIGGKKNVTKIGSILFGMAAAMLVLTLVVKLLAGMDVTALLKGIIATAALAGIVVGLVAATKLMGSRAKKMTGTLLIMSICIGILAFVATILGLLDTDHLVKGITAVSILSGMMALMIAATKGSKNAKATVMAMTVAIVLMAAAVLALSFINSSDLKRATGALTAVMGMFTLMIASTKLMKSGKSTLKNLLVMVGVVAVLALIIAALSFVDTSSAMTTASALSLLMLSIATSLVIMGAAGRISSTVSKQIFPMLAVVAGLAVILGILGALEVEASIQSAVALSTLLNSMAAALVILGTIKRVNKKAIGALAIIGLVVAEIAAIMAIMSAFDIDVSIETATALSTLLLALSAACFVISKIPISGAIMGALGFDAFVAIIAALIAALGGLSMIPGFNELMAGGGEVLGLIGYAIGNFVGSIVGGFSAGATSGLPKIAEHLSDFMEKVTPFIEGATAIQPGSMDGIKALAEAVLTLVGANILDALSSIFTGGSSISDFASKLSELGEGLTGFADSLDGFDNSKLDSVTCAANAVKVLADAAAAIPNEGGWIADIVGDNSISTFGKYLPDLGKHISSFADNLGGFDSAKLDTVTCAANAIKVLAEAADEIPNEGGWLAAIVGDNSISTFGAYLPDLGKHISSFADNIGGFDNSKLDSVTCAATAVKELALAAHEIPNEGGLWAKIAGDNSIATFGEHLPKLGENLNDFAGALTNFSGDGSKVNAVAQAAKSIEVLALAAKLVPNEGGLWAKIAGTNGLSAFADKLPTLGTNLNDFAGKLTNFGGDSDKTSAVSSAANSIKELALAAQAVGTTGGIWECIVGKSGLSEFSSDLPTLGTNLNSFAGALTNFGGDGDKSAVVSSAANAIKELALAAEAVGTDGGLWGAIVGNSGLSKFSSDLPTLGTNLNSFAGALTNFGGDNDKTAAVSSAATAIKDLALAAQAIGDDTSIWAVLVGDSGLSNFAEKLPALGEGINGFADKLGSFDDATVKTVNSAVKAIEAIAELSGSDMDVGNIEDLTDELPDFAEALVDFKNGLPDATSIDSAISALDKLIKAIKDIADINSGALSEFADNMKSVSEEGVKEFIGAFTSEAAKTDLRTAAENLAKEAVSGSDSQKENIKTAGKNLVEGFAEGITENTFMAEAQAKAMADAAAAAAKKQLAINSPSKVFRAIGYSVPEGFAMGIDRMSRLSDASSADMANNAIRSVKNAISRVADMVNTDIDSQPTIRPVLDLSDVRAGVNTIGNLLDTNSSVGVVANVGSISSMMNGYSQNGTNDDVVSAINKLRSDLGNVRGDTYNVNGVTYDDGSNITEAVRTIVRAARIERRV